MRPVSAEHRISQAFGSGATQGIAPNPDKNSGWGYYVHLYGNYQPFGHAGLDIACPVGTPIYAPADGTVIYAGWSEDLPGTGAIRKWLFYYNFGGILTLIQHNGWISVLAHQSTNDAVHVGMRVKEGQVIGKSGDTKTRTTKVAPHVHVEAIVDLSYKTGGGLIYGRANPEPFFGSGMAAMGSITEATPEPEEPLVPNESDKVFFHLDGGPKVSLNEFLNDLVREARSARAATQALLSVQLPDPSEPGATYSLADYIVWGATNAKHAAGAAGVAAGNTSPEALAKAVTDAQGGATAQAIAAQLQISVKE